MSDKMREEFEAWYLENYCGGTERLKKCTNDDSSYYYCGVQAMWTPWQASRESLVIDLDAAARTLAESVDYPWEFMPEQGRTRMKANARMVIEAAGLKVKS